MSIRASIALIVLIVTLTAAATVGAVHFTVGIGDTPPTVIEPPDKRTAAMWDLIDSTMTFESLDEFCVRTGGGTLETDIFRDAAVDFPDLGTPDQIGDAFESYLKAKCPA